MCVHSYVCIHVYRYIKYLVNLWSYQSEIKPVIEEVHSIFVD